MIPLQQRMWPLCASEKSLAHYRRSIPFTSPALGRGGAFLLMSITRVTFGMCNIFGGPPVTSKQTGRQWTHTAAVCKSNTHTNTATALCERAPLFHSHFHSLTHSHYWRQATNHSLALTLAGRSYINWLQTFAHAIKTQLI